MKYLSPVQGQYLCFISSWSSESYLRESILFWLFINATATIYYFSQFSRTKEVEFEQKQKETNFFHLTIIF